MMNFSPIASLLVAGALIAPLAVQAQDKPASPAKVWVKDSVVTTKIKTLLAAEKMSSLALVHVETDANGLVSSTTWDAVHSLPLTETLPGGGVRHNCTDCHRYHHGDQPMQGRGGDSWFPKDPRDLADWLKGK